MEGRLSGEEKPVHHHTRHPEEDDVIPGFHHTGWVEVIEIRGRVRPAKDRERP